MDALDSSRYCALPVSSYSPSINQAYPPATSCSTCEHDPRKSLYAKFCGNSSPLTCASLITASTDCSSNVLAVPSPVWASCNSEIRLLTKYQLSPRADGSWGRLFMTVP